MEHINAKWSVYFILNDSSGTESALNEVSGAVQLTYYSRFYTRNNTKIYWEV